MDKIKILVVDDHPMVIEGMRYILAQIKFTELIATATNAFQALEAIENYLPDIVITDISMPDISGIELTAKIKKEFPKIKIIGMSTFNERSYITQMIISGADGYLMKSASKEEIEKALLTVDEGKMYLGVDIEINSVEKNALKEIPVISNREKEVLALIAEGLTNPQIAEKLFVSVHTIDSHRKSLLTKFSVNNTAGLIKQATKYHFI